MWASLKVGGASDHREKPPAIQKTGLRLWVRKIPWRREWLPTPVFLSGEFPWIEEPGGLQFMRLQRVRPNWVTEHSTKYGVRWGVLYVLVKHKEKTSLNVSS